MVITSQKTHPPVLTCHRTFSASVGKMIQNPALETLLFSATLIYLTTGCTKYRRYPILNLNNNNNGYCHETKCHASINLP